MMSPTTALTSRAKASCCAPSGVMLASIRAMAAWMAPSMSQAPPARWGSMSFW